MEEKNEKACHRPVEREITVSCFSFIHEMAAKSIRHPYYKQFLFMLQKTRIALFFMCVIE